MYYTYARMVLEGEDFNMAYNVDYFDAKVSEYGMNTKDIPNNLPTNALVLLPIAWLPPPTAKIVWSVISLVAFVLSMKMILQVYGIHLTSNLGLGLMTLCLAWRPAYDNIALGQLYMVILLIFTLSLQGIQKEKVLMTGLSVSTACLIKGYGIVPVLWMITRMKWKMVLLTVAFTVLVFVLTLPVFGLGSWTQFGASIVTNLGASPSEAHVAYQTINGLVYHLFFYDPIWSPFPVARFPLPILLVISYGLSVLLIVLILRKIGSEERHVLLLSYSSAIAVSVVTAPLAEEYHYVLFLPLVVGLILFRVKAWVENQRFKSIDVFLLSAIVLMVLPLKYKTLQLESFPMILLAYPRLIAGLVLLLLARRVAKHSETCTDTVDSLDRNGYIPANPNEIR